jgi:hypothetical protein
MNSDSILDLFAKSILISYFSKNKLFRNREIEFSFCGEE